MEHIQEKDFNAPTDLHVFTIGCGGLTEFGALTGGLPPCNEVRKILLYSA